MLVNVCKYVLLRLHKSPPQNVKHRLVVSLLSFHTTITVEVGPSSPSFMEEEMEA